MSSPIDAEAAPASLRRNALWNLGGIAVYSVAQWSLIAVIARDDVVAAGEYALAMTIVTPVALFAGLNLRIIQAVDEDDWNFHNHLALRLAALLVALPISIALMYGIGTDGTFLPTLLAFAVARWVESVSGTMYGVFLSKRVLRRLAIGLALRGGVGLLLGVVAWFATGRVTVVGWALAGGWTAVLLAVEYPWARGMVGSIDRPTFEAQRRLVTRGLPLGLDSAANSLSHHGPRIIIQHASGTAALGRYTPVAQLAQYGTVVSGAVGTALLAQLSEYARAGDSVSFTRLVRRVVGLGVLGALVLAVVTAAVGPPLIELLLGAEFADRPLIAWMGLAVGVISVERLLARALQALGFFTSVLRIDLTIAVVVTIGALVLVPPFGNAGAAAAIAAGFAFGCGLVVTRLGAATRSGEVTAVIPA